MKKAILVVSIIFGTLLFAGETAVQTPVNPKPEKVVTQKEMMALALRSMYLIQDLSKDYLYKSSGLHSASLDVGIQKNIAELGVLRKEFVNCICDSSPVKRYLEIIAVAEENIRSIAREKYSLENMQLLLDLGSVISEAGSEIVAAAGEGAKIYKKDSKERIAHLSAL